MISTSDEARLTYQKRSRILNYCICFVIFCILFVFFYFKAPNIDTIQVQEINDEFIHDDELKEPMQVSEKPLSAKTLKFMENVKNSCPNWSDEFRDTFASKCSHWIEEYSDWLEHPTQTPPLIYACIYEKNCDGLGDRLAGMQGVLSFSIEFKRRFRAQWKGLDELFQTCMFKGTNMGEWNRETKMYGDCHTGSNVCARDRGRIVECGKAPSIFENYNRGCLPSGMCDKSRQNFPQNLNAANLYGCGLRAMLEPTPKFLDYLIPFHDGENGVRMMSIAEAQTYMSQFYVIAIHFRLGDDAAFLDPKSMHVTAENRDFLIPFQCASTIQSYVERRQVESLDPTVQTTMQYIKTPSDEEYSVRGKPVRWFLASDSNSLREMALRLFGDKLFMVTNKPVHIALKQQDNALANTFAEWYLLGLSNDLVLNRIHGRTLFNGRLSSFPKTGWVYNMKHIYYNAYSCLRRNMLLDGTWQVAPPECSKPASFRQHLPQPHLFDGNITLPNVWVDRGKVYSFGDKFAQNDEDEDSG